MARSDPSRVLAAQLTGVAAGYAHVRRLTADEALAELATELTNAKVKPGSGAARETLTAAAAHYVIDGEPALQECWYADALALLVRAGADEDAARRSIVAPGSKPIPGQGYRSPG
jgi:hypothetical protein